MIGYRYCVVTSTAGLHVGITTSSIRVLSLTDAMPDDNNVRQLYSHLCRAFGLDDGFDPTDSSVWKSTVALLTEINHLLSTEYDVVRGYGNKNINYVRVPQTCSDDSFRNTKEWLDVAIRISGSKEGDTFNSAYRIANHLWRFYKDSVLAACETQRIAVICCYDEGSKNYRRG